MDKLIIEQLIKILESRPATPENVEELANLYIVYDHLENKAE